LPSNEANRALIRIIINSYEEGRMNVLKKTDTSTKKNNLLLDKKEKKRKRKKILHYAKMKQI
jgi:hypothetical protein